MEIVALIVGFLCGFSALRSLARRWRGHECKREVAISGFVVCLALIVGKPILLAFFAVVPVVLGALIAWTLAAGGVYIIGHALIAFAPDRRVS